MFSTRLVGESSRAAWYCSLIGVGIDRAWRASLFYHGAFSGLELVDYYMFGGALGVAALVIALIARMQRRVFFRISISWSAWFSWLLERLR